VSRFTDSAKRLHSRLEEFAEDTREFVLLTEREDTQNVLEQDQFVLLGELSSREIDHARLDASRSREDQEDSSTFVKNLQRESRNSRREVNILRFLNKT